MASKPLETAERAMVPANDTDETITIKGVAFTQSQVADPCVINDRMDEIADALIENEIYFTRYYPDNRVMGLGEINEIFEKMAEAPSLDKMNAPGIIEISERGVSVDTLEYDEVVPAIKSFISDLKDEAENAGWKLAFDPESDDGDQSVIELREMMVEKALEKDESEPTDILGHCDYVEVCYVLCPTGLYASDYQIEAGRYCDYDAIAIDQGLLDLLPRLGHTLTDYRKHSGNRDKRRDPPSKTPKRTVPLVSLDTLKEIVENTGASNLNITLYAQLPLRDLLRMDFTRPITLKNYCIAGIDFTNGCFFDERVEEPIVIRPGDGIWRGFSGNNGPSEWCGMSNSYYHGEVSQ